MPHLLRPTAVNAILGEVRKVQAAGTSVISLMRGEPDFRTPAHIVEQNRLDYEPLSEVLVTTGATMGIYLALMALISNGEDVLVPEPIFDLAHPGELA